ncbi:hypothetical protein Syun_005537 [Stephania yunnanensis]|uniref:GDSL esterase/lipase n=1 Tax=Stephania yunnanensis TaxID=152371 RepID=A0AAP0Q2D4_9MAGN
MSSLLLILALSLSALTLSNAAGGPALFIFGDSITDVGTNNGLDSMFKADHPPYGIDFPGNVSTGRFSNGFNPADFLAQKLGFEKSPPPFLAIANQSVSLKQQIVSGVNFASGGAGLLDDTKFGSVVTLSQQIQQFQTVRSNLTQLLGEAEAESFMNKSIVAISAGSTDIAVEFVRTRAPPTPEFITSLRDAYESHLKTLYSLGARKFGIASVPAIGCVPFMRAANDTGGCSEVLNDYSQSFYSAIEPMLQNLSTELVGMKYSLGNAYQMMMSYFNEPSPSGPTELQTACCGGGKFNGQQPCDGNATVCEDRDKYVFWDLFHPTRATAALAIEAFYSGTTEFVTPINLQQLIEDN